MQAKQTSTAVVTTTDSAAPAPAGSEQSASLEAAIAEGTVMQQSSQPILTGPGVTATEAVTTTESHTADMSSMHEAAESEATTVDSAPEGTSHTIVEEALATHDQPAAVSEIAVSDIASDPDSSKSASFEAALAQGTVMQESSQPILSGLEVAVIEVADAATLEADVAEAAPTEAAALTSAVAQMSDAPILTEGVAAPAPEPTQQALLLETPLPAERELVQILHPAEQTALLSVQRIQTPSVASAHTQDAVALSEGPILDPAAEDVNIVDFSARQSASQGSVDGVAAAVAQQQIVSASTAAQTLSTVPQIVTPQMQSQIVTSEQPRLVAATYTAQTDSQASVMKQQSFSQFASQAVLTEQPSMSAVLQRPPVPALPSKLRRSRSDLPIAQQMSSSSPISQQSLAQMEGQAGMRRSISNLQAVSPKLPRQSSLSQSVAYMPALSPAVETRQPASPLKAALTASAIPAIPIAPAKPVHPVQQITTTVQQTPATAVQVNVMQQPVSASIATRDMAVQPAVQTGPVFMRSFGSFRPPSLPQAPLAVIQEQQPQQLVSVQQNMPMYSTGATASQQLATYPAPLGSPPAQRPQFLRTAAVPASVSFQPMTSAVTVDAQGPLSKGVQDSWNSIPAPALLQQQPPPLTVPQTASSWHQGTLHAPVAPTSSQHFMPLGISYDNIQMPILPRVATPNIATARALQPPVMRSLQQPAMYDMQQAAFTAQPQAASANMTYTATQGPLRQSMPMPMPQSVKTSMPYGQSPGTVIQPMSSTVIVGQQAQETQRLAQSGPGFSIVPLQQAAQQAQQQGLQQQSLQQQIMARPGLARSQTGSGMHASRALQAFSRSRSSFGSGDIPFDTSYSAQQHVSSGHIIARCCIKR